MPGAPARRPRRCESACGAFVVVLTADVHGADARNWGDAIVEEGGGTNEGPGLLRPGPSCLAGHPAR
jgi:hypothetical protein